MSTSASQQVKEKEDKVFTCMRCDMKFKSSSQKQAHKKKNRCQKKVQNLHYLLSQEDKVLAIMPD